MNELDIQVELMRAAGIKDSSILKLTEAKAKIARGELDDFTIEYKRAMFLKHLIKAGRLRERAVTPVQKHFSDPESINPVDSVDINSQP